MQLIKTFIHVMLDVICEHIVQGKKHEQGIC